MRRLALPSMVLALLAYMAAHSPALGVIARAAGLPGRRCYFTCSGWIAAAHLPDAAAAVVLLGAAGVAAWIIAGRIRVRPYERPLAFGLGALALVAAPSAALGAAGWAAGTAILRPPVGPLLAAVPGLLVVAVALARDWRPTSVPRLLLRLQGLAAVFAVLAGALLVTSAAITLGHPPTGYDALGYHGPLAVYFWRDGNLGTFLDRTPWAHALAHPGTAELWFGLLRIAAGEHAASLGQLPFALLGSAAVYAFARRTGLGSAPSWLGALAFLLAPTVVAQSGSQVNDLIAGALLMTAVAFASAPATEWTATRYALVGLALGCAITTKLAVLPAAGAIAVAVGIAGIRRHRARDLLPALAMGALMVAPWWLRNIVLFGNPIYPAALPLVGRGYVTGDFAQKDAWFVPARWAWPAYPLVEPHSDMSGFGAVFVVGALVGLLAPAPPRRGAEARRLYGLVAAVSLPAWWLLTQHEPRLLLGVFGLGFAFVGWALVAVPRRSRREAARLCAIAALFSALVTVDQALRPLARAPSGRAEFYDRVWGVDSVVAGLPEREGLLYHTGHARLSYAGDYALLGPSLGRQLVVIDGELPCDSIVALMRRAGVAYAYIPAAADAQAAVAAMYPAARFEVLRVSTIEAGKSQGVRRYLFRLRDPR